MERRSWIIRAVSVALLLGTGCGDDDGGGNQNNDNDAQPVCGNGVVETGEQCDEGTANDDALPGACRTTCRAAHCGDGVIDPGESCDTQSLGGLTCPGVDPRYDGGDLACSATCELDASGCTECGDGVRAGAEACDGTDLGGEGCVTLGLGQHGILRCDAACGLDASGCHTCGDGNLEPAEACEPELLPTCAEAGYSGGSRTCLSTCDLVGACESVCGNGIVEPDEACDGLVLGGATCASLGFHAGTLGCSASCQLDTGACTRCGNGVIEGSAGEACDGTELGGATCATALGAGYTGAAGCDAGCRLDLSGCTAPASCGDGVASGEPCDGADLQGQTCLSVRPGAHGGGALACRTNCTFDESGCLPADPCGDGLAELSRGEQCDGADLGGASCSSLGLPGGTLGCRTDCRFDLTGCDPPVGCGNALIDPGEVCDGVALGGQTCVSAGFHAGVLGCTAWCTLDFSGCTSCGDDVRNAGEACDGADLGGDTCANHAFADGTLTCRSDCTAVDLSQCTGGTCVDEDGDLHGPGCAAGSDCDDAAPGIIGACQSNGCPQGWAYVPSGAFEMGCDDGDACWTGEANESPRHTVTLPAYCVQVTEVPVVDYRDCHAAGACPGVPTGSATNDLCNYSPTSDGRDRQPLNCVTWADAVAFCQEWLGGDLPTEAEWEKAARGADERVFPWGNAPEPECTRANHDVNDDDPGYGCMASTQGPLTWEVGFLASSLGDSPYGVKDLAGNLWEWARDYYGETFYESCSAGCDDPFNADGSLGPRVIRGGSAFEKGGMRSLRTVARYAAPPGDTHINVGFRCRRVP